jgi:lysophospholipid acyltransferase (LPLAT)-like uncharacterized protein
MRLRSRTLTQASGFALAATHKALARTLTYVCRTEWPDGENPEDPRLPPSLFCLWHDAILIPLATLTRVKVRWPIHALVSRHQDGSYLAEFMRHLGVTCIRGSTRRGGDQAVRSLMRLSEAAHIYITPDGPRGPRREIKPGIVFLAAQTGMPIVPVGTAGTAGWRVPGTWTDLYVPKPFTRVAHYLGAPLYVSGNASRTQLLREQRRLESEMVRVEVCAGQVLRGESVSCREWKKAA